MEIKAFYYNDYLEKWVEVPLSKVDPTDYYFEVDGKMTEVGELLEKLLKEKD